jgi:hypothetical protein
VGLQKGFSAYNENTNPARYAIIDVYYNDYASVRRIYLRQGEGADFLMRQGDAGINVTNNRNLVVKILPFNLTADNLNAAVAQNGGKLTKYPSQTGAFFQWAQANPSTKINWAWSPIGSPVGGWDSGNSASSWSSAYETCPSGYRRPTDGNPDSYGVNIANTEIRQSLWLNPQPGTNGWGSPNNQDNSFDGYYADGHYDRRKPDNDGGVSTGNEFNIAYRGKLFYNPNNHASVFLPLGGYRSGSSGEVSGRGYPGVGYYWLSTTVTAYGSSLNLQNDGFTITSGGSKNKGASIRCVRTP